MPLPPKSTCAAEIATAPATAAAALLLDLHTTLADEEVVVPDAALHRAAAPAAAAAATAAETAIKQHTKGSQLGSHFLYYKCWQLPPNSLGCVEVCSYATDLAAHSLQSGDTCGTHGGRKVWMW